MITNVTFFDNSEDLEILTGHTHEELWELGFNLDDMDCGFCTEAVGCFEVEKREDEFGYTRWEWKHDIHDLYYRCDGFPAAIHKLLDDWENYCVGYCIAYCDGMVYVTLHHA